MIRITQLRLPVHHTDGQLRDKIIKTLRIRPGELQSYTIARRSLDARDKSDIRYSYAVDVTLADGARPGRRIDGKELISFDPQPYKIPRVSLNAHDTHGRAAPVIVGCGPAGLFAGLALARAGLSPIIIERGEPAAERKKCVERFWETGELNMDSNVCFGEGGAGTFSDGKLNTLVKDTDGRHAMVLRTLVEFGADPPIMYDQKPHIGTDQLIGIVTAMRREIERLGGTVLFNTRLADIITDDAGICAVVLEKSHTASSVESCGRAEYTVGDSCRDAYADNKRAGRENNHEACREHSHENRAEGGHHEDMEHLPCRELILATGHSARDTFAMLRGHGIYMQPKAFAVGLRIQHPQEMIDISQFGEREASFLSPASYKLTARTGSGRGVYSFCMCPGGYVVNASTEHDMLTVNGMSYSGRDSGTANSALIVTVTPEDFTAYKGYCNDGCNRAHESCTKRGQGCQQSHMSAAARYHENRISEPQLTDPMIGIEFQRMLEQAAYREGGGSIPVQLLGDYLRGADSKAFGDTVPRFKGAYTFGRLDRAFPAFIREAIADVMPEFARKIKGYDREDAVLAGIEGRTSSPVRIVRDERGIGSIPGLYPCGEGAGYAGGITSAAMDGLLAAERIIEKYL